MIAELDPVPFDQEAESALLGGIVCWPDSWPEVDFLRYEDFYRPINGAMYEGLRKLIEGGLAVTYEAIFAEVGRALREHRDAASESDIHMLGLYGDRSPPTSFALVGYAERVESLARRRAKIAAHRLYLSRLCDTTQALEDIPEPTAKDQAPRGDAWAPIAEGGDELLDSIEARMDGLVRPSPTFPLKAMADIGLEAGDLVLLGGRPGSGKTSLSQQLAVTLAETGEPVGYISLEMPRQQLLLREMCARGGVNYQAARTGRLTRDELVKLRRVRAEVAHLPLYIDDRPKSPASLVRAARRLKGQYPDIRVIVVDYLSLLTAPEGENQNIRISLISQALKGAARSLDVAMVVLVQLNRQGAEGMPELHHLRDSGSLEQDADLVVFIYRPYAVTQRGDPTEAHIKVAKNRHGATLTERVTFVPRAMRFEDYQGSVTNDEDPFA